MFRRQIPDRVNPRNVLPSRHTLFIRGLPGSTDVTKVKEYFSAETNSKCSVDFFSTSDDKQRLSVAIRFKSHDLAKEMLAKYNNKVLLGFPVEMNWFKDFKKARAKVFEEQRLSGARQFQRMPFRGNFRSNDRRNMAMSPNGYNDGRHTRAGSSSSGGIQSSGMGRQRFSRSRSRSYTGSSSRSASGSGRSASASPHLRRMSSQHAADGMRGFSDNQPAFGEKRVPRNHSYRSVSGSSSSSRSSAGAHARRTSVSGRSMNPKTQQAHYQHTRGNASPLNFGSGQREKRISGSTPQDYSSFTNAPAPDIDGGSSLVSGLIQLKRRNQPELQPELSRRRHRPSSIGSSSSGLSGHSPARGAADPAIGATRHGFGKHMSSLSPPYAGLAPANYNQRSAAPDQSALCSDDMGAFSKRKRHRHHNRSPGSLSPGVEYAGPTKSMDVDAAFRRRTPALEQEPISRHSKRQMAKTGQSFQDESLSSEEVGDMSRRRVARTSPSDVSDWRPSKDIRTTDPSGWSRSSRHGTSRGRKAPKTADESPREQSVESESDTAAESFRKRPNNKGESQDEVAGVFKEATEDTAPDEKVDSTFDIIRQHKETLAQDYKRDCEAFTTVVRTLISSSFHGDCYVTRRINVQKFNFCTSGALFVWVVVIIVVHEAKTVFDDFPAVICFTHVQSPFRPFLCLNAFLATFICPLRGIRMMYS